MPDAKTEHQYFISFFELSYNERTLVWSKICFLLQDIEHVYVDHSWKCAAKKWIFCVKTANKAFTLCAPTAESMRIWVDVIFTGADGHPEAYGLPI